MYLPYMAAAHRYTTDTVCTYPIWQLHTDTQHSTFAGSNPKRATPVEVARALYVDPGKVADLLYPLLHGARVEQEHAISYLPTAKRRAAVC